MGDPIWKDIPGYEGLYKASSSGLIKRVKSISLGMKNRTLEEQILNGWLNSNGYLSVELTNIFGTKTFTVHRLIAITFLINPNPLEFTEVNHINECKLNNYVTNLEWVSPRINSNHGSRNERISENLLLKVIRIDKDPLFGSKIYNSIKSTSEDGFRKKSVVEVCSGRDNYHYGYKWQYYFDFMMKNYYPNISRNMTFDPIDYRLVRSNFRMKNNSIIVSNSYGAIIYIFKNREDAILMSGFEKWTIIDLCSGRRNDIFGNKWEFYKDYVDRVFHKGSLDEQTSIY